MSTATTCALVDDDDALAGLRHLGEDVRAEDDRVVAGQLLDELARLDDLLRVEAGGRFVEDEHVGIVDQGLGQADALPVALRSFAQRRSAMSAMRVRSITARDARAAIRGEARPSSWRRTCRYSLTVMSG